MYKVYKILPEMLYQGFSLVAATDINEANKYIENFKRNDKYQFGCSNGFKFICEFDTIEHLYSDVPGIIHNGITHIYP